MISNISPSNRTFIIENNRSISSSLPSGLPNWNQDVDVEKIFRPYKSLFCSKYILVSHLKNGKRNAGKAATNIYIWLL